MVSRKRKKLRQRSTIFYKISNEKITQIPFEKTNLMKTSHWELRTDFNYDKLNCRYHLTFRFGSISAVGSSIHFNLAHNRG